MADKNMIMKNSVEKILKNLVQKSPAFKDVDSAKLKFLFRAPIKTAMCDWVYGVEVTTKSDEVNQINISGTISQSVSKTISMISKDTLCLTEINFESAY